MKTLTILSLFIAQGSFAVAPTATCETGFTMHQEIGTKNFCCVEQTKVRCPEGWTVNQGSACRVDASTPPSQSAGVTLKYCCTAPKPVCDMPAQCALTSDNICRAKPGIPGTCSNISNNCCKFTPATTGCPVNPACMLTTNTAGVHSCCQLDNSNPAVAPHCKEGAAGPLACLNTTMVNGKCCRIDY